MMAIMAAGLLASSNDLAPTGSIFVNAAVQGTGVSAKTADNTTASEVAPE